MRVFLGSTTLGNAVLVSEIEPVREPRVPTLLSVIASLSIAATTLSLMLAAAISLIVWAVG